jgi:thymidylate kinase
VVAIVGPDGSGKSTLCRELVARYSVERPVLPIYFGSGDGPASLARRPLKFARKLALGAKGETQRKASIERRAPGALRGPRVLWALTLGHEKRAKLAQAARARAEGTLVVCDRYPQAQTAGCVDGPLLADWRSSDSAMKRRLAVREARPYEQADAEPPDLVLRLGVDAETLALRRPDHDQLDLARRRAIVESLRFGPSAVTVEIDTAQPLEDVIAQARKVIDDCLREHEVLR